MSHPQLPHERRAALIAAYRLIEELEVKVAAAERSHAEPIAIIGMGCRLPGGGNDPEAFWQLLRDGVDTTSDIPADRWDIEAYYDPDPEAPGKMYMRRGAFLTGDIGAFDAQFFGIAPREAEEMDPQHRLLLEVAWEALERAGVAPDRLACTVTGVYIGVMSIDYGQVRLKSINLHDINPYLGTGNGVDFAAGRLSYFLGLQGPSMVVATACSSSLVATHLACQALRLRECDLALAGGVNLIISPHTNIVISKLRAGAPDGRCKVFDSSADGYGRGEGAGLLVLKRLADA
jgi:acyl transferase domain-containing protein